MKIELSMDDLLTLMNWKPVEKPWPAEEGDGPTTPLKIQLKDLDKKVKTPDSEFSPSRHAYKAEVGTAIADFSCGTTGAVFLIVHLDDPDSVPRGATTKFWLRAEEALFLASELRQFAKIAAKKASKRKGKRK